MPEKFPANVTTTDLHQQALLSRYNLALFLHYMHPRPISAFVGTVAAQPATKETAWFTDLGLVPIPRLRFIEKIQ